MLVVGSAGVGLAHIDSDSVGHAKKLALGYDSLGWDFEKNCMVNTLEIPARECRITEGVSRWKLSTFTDGQNPFQR